MKTVATSEVTLSLNGQIIGTAKSLQMDLPCPVWPTEFTAAIKGFSARIKVAGAEMKRVLQALNPAIKEFHHWERVKLAQERRRLARRRQGRS